MMESDAANAPKPGRTRVALARSLPSRKSYDQAVFLSILQYFGMFTAGTALVCFIIQPSHLATRLIIGGTSFAAFTWFIGLFKRRSTFCPLCKGTPLINTGARTHSRAFRLHPFNHGVTATLSILATQRFRCMYCGSDYDLLKVPSHRRTGDGTGSDS